MCIQSLEMEKYVGIAICFLLMGVWEVHAQVNCTSAGRFAETTDTTCRNYTLCVLNSATNTYLSYNYVCPGTSVFNPTTSQCTDSANYNCVATNTTTSVCTTDGFIADPTSTNCSSYIQCVNISGVFSETTLTCPAPSLYNPATTLCDTSYNCTSTTASTCTSAGRFAVSTDSTCQTYNLCVLAADGTYTQYLYTCPTTSLFNPTSGLCTTTYTCTT